MIAPIYHLTIMQETKHTLTSYNQDKTMTQSALSCPEGGLKTYLR